MGEPRRIKSGYSKVMALKKQREYKKMAETVDPKALERFKRPPYYLDKKENGE